MAVTNPPEAERGTNRCPLSSLSAESFGRRSDVPLPPDHLAPCLCHVCGVHEILIPEFLAVCLVVAYVTVAPTGVLKL